MIDAVLLTDIARPTSDQIDACDIWTCRNDLKATDCSRKTRKWEIVFPIFTVDETQMSFWETVAIGLPTGQFDLHSTLIPIKIVGLFKHESKTTLYMVINELQRQCLQSHKAQLTITLWLLKMNRFYQKHPTYELHCIVQQQYILAIVFCCIFWMLFFH